MMPKAALAWSPVLEFALMFARFRGQWTVVSVVVGCAAAAPSSAFVAAVAPFALADARRDR